MYSKKFMDVRTVSIALAPSIFLQLHYIKMGFDFIEEIKVRIENLIV